MTHTTKYLLSFVGSFLSAIVLASFFSIQTTSHQVVRLEEKIESLRSQYAIADSRFRDVEDRLKILESKK